jgi:Zn-dependent peptidase ImmA (M78 family)
MLKEIIDAVQLSPEFCASVARVPIEQFQDWMNGRQEVPHFVLPELSALLGVSETELLSRKPTGARSGVALAPAIWFKLRDSRLGDADREFVGLVKRLGLSMAELDRIINTRSSSIWSATAQGACSKIDRAAPPAQQGIEAADRFRTIMEWDHGQTGIGELLRPTLRRKGLVVIESPVPKSSLEGCCFEIGIEEKRPCVFANTFKSTWFRRNEIILHEVCHAIFDIENDQVTLDFSNQPEGADIPEERARAFSQECLVPHSVLMHYSSQLGLHWNRLRVEELAQLAAQIHIEPRLVLRAAYAHALITKELYDLYQSYECASLLRGVSDHALSTREYLQKLATDAPVWMAPNRTTSLGTTRRLRLPSGYVQRVIDATRGGEISEGKAAEMLMMDRYTFAEKFGAMLGEPALA